MSDLACCAHCGGDIPPRTDPRGRKARYCSSACRAAASRARRTQQHHAEVAEAREQLALDMQESSEQEAARIVDLNAWRILDRLNAHIEWFEAQAEPEEPEGRGFHEGYLAGLQEARRLVESRGVRPGK